MNAPTRIKSTKTRPVFSKADLDAALKKHSLNYYTVAKLSGVDDSALRKIKSGARTSMSAKNCGKLAAVLPDTRFATTWEHAIEAGAAAPGTTGDVPPGYALLDLDALKPSPLNPRMDFDEAGIALFADDIARRGVLQNLVARPPIFIEGAVAISPLRPAELIAGERRWRACMALKHAGEWPPASIPSGKLLVQLKDVSDNEVVALGLIENMQRSDLNPIEEGEAFEKLLKTDAWDRHSIADAIGKSKRHVDYRLSLVNLNDEARTMLLEGDITVEQARQIATQEPDKQIAALEPATKPALEATPKASSYPGRAASREPEKGPRTPEPNPGTSSSETQTEAFEGEEAAPGEANDCGVITPTETLLVWSGHNANYLHAKIQLAQTGDEWRATIAYSDSAGGCSGPIRDTDPTYPLRDTAIHAAARELAEHAQERAADGRLTVNACRDARAIIKALSILLADDDKHLGSPPPAPHKAPPSSQNAPSPKTAPPENSSTASAALRFNGPGGFTLEREYGAKQAKHLKASDVEGFMPYADLSIGEDGTPETITIIHATTGQAIKFVRAAK